MRKMKDSGTQWLGDIPLEWKIRRLRFLCDITTGNMDTQNNNPEGEYPFYVRSPIVERSNEYTFDNEAVLMAGDGVGAGKVFHYVNGKYGCHQRVYSMSNFSEITGKYLYYYLLENFYMKIEESNAKSTVDSVRLPMLKDFPVVFPSIDEQEKIVKYLDEKCSKIDAIIARQEEIIEKLKEYKLSVITEAVCRGIKPEVLMKESGNEFVGSIPVEWTLTKVKNIASKVTDGAHVSPETENGIFDFVSTVNLEQDCIHYETSLKTSASSYEYLVSTGCKPEKGDILISKDGSVGRTAIVEDDRDFVVSSSLVIISPLKTVIDSAFLNYSLQSKPIQETLLMMMQGAGLKRVSVAKNANLPIVLPSIKEQIEIVSFLSEQCLKIELNVRNRRNMIDKLRCYRKSLIYEVVTGKKEV